MSSFIKKSLSVAALGLTLGVSSFSASASGLPITLPTGSIDANSTFAFSEDSTYLMESMGISVTGLGNATRVAGDALAFNMPVTEVSVNVGLLPPSLTPVAGEAMGSALGFQRKGADGFVLANFGLDFKRNVLQADFITAGGTTKSMDVFNFEVEQGLKISMNGGLSLNMALDSMFLTSTAQQRFASALKLPSYAVSGLSLLDFGTLGVDIDPSLRFGLSTKAYTAGVVPEAPQIAMMLLGIAGLAMVSNRRRRD